jgi:hypothetical protein
LHLSISASTNCFFIYLCFAEVETAIAAIMFQSRNVRNC